MFAVGSPQRSDRSPLLLASAAGLLGVLLYLYATRDSATPSDPPHTKLRVVPRPRETLPILGNLLVYYKYRHGIREWVTRQCLEFHGEPWVRKIPGQPEMVTFSSPEHIEEITTTQFENFEKGEFQIEIIAGAFGRGIVASDGDRWLHQRKAAAHFFSARSLRALMDQSLHKNLEQVCKVLDDTAQDGGLVDLKKLFHDFTLQTFVEMGVGVELNWIGSKEQHAFQRAVDQTSPIVATRFRRPAWFWKTQRWLKVGAERELAALHKTVYGWLHELIEMSLQGAEKRERSADTATDEAATKSVLELFAQHSHENKDGLRASDLADFLLTFIVAARDTTASTLAWLFFALREHPHVDAKLRSEMQQRLPELYGHRDVVLTPDHIKVLTYLEATVRETLRLYPAAPATVKQVVRDTVIGADIPLRKGQICVLHAYAMARNPRVWGDDAAQFKPERWIGADGQIRHFPPSKFFTFHAGPRTCIGMNLALLELRSVTANLINRYTFDIDKANDGSYSPGPTFVMKHALLTKVTSLVT